MDLHESLQKIGLHNFIYLNLNTKKKKKKKKLHLAEWLNVCVGVGEIK